MKVNKYVVSNLRECSELSDIESSIKSHDGINAVRVDTQANTITVDYDDHRYNTKDIVGLVNQAGLNVVDIK